MGYCSTQYDYYAKNWIFFALAEQLHALNYRMKIQFDSTVVAATVFIFGIVSTATLSILMMYHNDASIDQAAAAVLSSTESKIADRLQRYEYGLRGARGALITANEQSISPALFKRYMLTRDIEREFPGARGFGFIRKVTEQQEIPYLKKFV